MQILLQTLNKPLDAFKTKNKNVAWGLVIVTIITNTIFEPILRLYAGSTPTELDFPHMLMTTLYGLCTYIILCGLFWLVCKAFGSKADFSDYISTWGMTYFPTLLCSIVVAITEVFFYLFWNSLIWGMLFNILFVGILVWKLVLYILYLKEIAGLKRGKMIGAFAIIGVMILLLAMMNGYIGLKTPIL